MRRKIKNLRQSFLDKSMYALSNTFLPKVFPTKRSPTLKPKPCHVFFKD